MIDSPARSDRPRVLVIDGDPVFRASLATFLHRRRIDVVAVASGEQGVRALPSFAPALCILDWLPAGSMTGLETAVAMHARDSSLHFLFLSAHPEPSWERRPACLRNAPLLYKPVDLEELTSVAWRLLVPEPPSSPPGGGSRFGGGRSFRRVALLASWPPALRSMGNIKNGWGALALIPAGLRF